MADGSGSPRSEYTQTRATVICLLVYEDLRPWRVERWKRSSCCKSIVMVNKMNVRTKRTLTVCIMAKVQVKMMTMERSVLGGC